MLAAIESGRLDAVLRRYATVHSRLLPDDRIPGGTQRRLCALGPGQPALRHRKRSRSSIPVPSASISRPRWQLAERVFGKSHRLWPAAATARARSERERITRLASGHPRRKATVCCGSATVGPLVVLLWPGTEHFEAAPAPGWGGHRRPWRPLFPGYRDKSDPYRIKNDGHPNATGDGPSSPTMLAARIRAEADADPQPSRRAVAF